MILSLDRQVTNYELSHDLVKADVAMNTMFFWVTYLEGHITIESAAVAKKHKQFCSAYLSSELGQLLPAEVQTFWRFNSEVIPQWYCTYQNKDEDISLETHGKTEADVRGHMLLEILKIKNIPKNIFWKEREEENED